MREQAVLARIADDLTAADPDLPLRMNRRSSTEARAPVTARQVALLAFAPLALIAVAAALPESWWTVRVLLIALLVVPWMPLVIGARHPGG